MSQMQQISIQLEGVGSVLKSRRFKVPAYQRSYAWELDHVNSLLNDIGDAIKNKEKEYFLGSIVVTGAPNGRFEVVDGQQRLTTVSLLIAAIKEMFENSGDLEVVSSVKSEFLASTDRKTKEKEPKLILNETDNELYQDLIESIASVDKDKYSRQSHKRLISSANCMLEYMKSLCDKSKDPEDDLHSWLDYLEGNMKVIVVTAPDDSNAFVIFETLNDRGLELAISDLLKNYLFHRSGEKIDETKNRWLTMVAILESASDDPLVVTYLRHFSMAKYGLIREKELFGVIKKKITNKKMALAFSGELSDSAKTYSALINTDHEYWSGHDPAVGAHVATLNLLGMTQIRPLLLAILNKFEKKKIKEAFRVLVSVAVRFQIVGGVGGGSLEKIYADTAKSVAEGEISTAKEIIAGFKTLPSDSAFKAAFSIISISKQNLARFYLRSLEEWAEGVNGEKLPSPDVNKVNLEHVLPITPTPEWDALFSKDELRAYQNRLGNLAIMASKLNSKIGNESFDAKKMVYMESSFGFTKSIAECDKWDKQAIENRQNDMAELAVKIWSI